MITNDTFAALRALIGRGEVVVSEHGYDELANDGLSAREIVEGFAEAIVIEDYPEYPKGPCILTLQTDREGQPIHVVWGYRRAECRRPWLSPRIGPTPPSGRKASRREENEKETILQARAGRRLRGRSRA